MPVHDWLKVSQGIIHDFHNAWVFEIKRVLNTGLLPPDYYALTEQVAGESAPDLTTLDLLTTEEKGPSTYTQAFASVPAFWRAKVEGSGNEPLSPG